MSNVSALYEARHLMRNADYDRAADHVVVWLRSLDAYADAPSDEVADTAWRLVWHRWRYLTGRLHDGQ